MNTVAAFGERPSSTVAARSRHHGHEQAPAMSRSHAAHFVPFALPDTERASCPTRKRASPFRGWEVGELRSSEGFWRFRRFRRFRSWGDWGVKKVKMVKEIKAVKEFQSSSLPRQRRLVPGFWFRDIGFAAKRLATSFICYPLSVICDRPRQRFPCSARSANLCGLCAPCGYTLFETALMVWRLD